FGASTSIDHRVHPRLRLTASLGAQAVPQFIEVELWGPGQFWNQYSASTSAGVGLDLWAFELIPQVGMHYAKEHPENLHAYVSVSSIVHANESERRNLQRLLERAALTKNTEAQAQLAKVQIPFRSWEDLYYLRWWTAELLGNGASEKIYPKTLFQEWSEKWLPVFREAAAVDYRKTAPSLNCPVYFFLSKRDFVANHELGEAYFQALQAERKVLIWFHESPHEIPSDEPEKFSEEMLKIARGLAEK
ncbi:MAG: hypothetical protein AAF597_17930, partial [Bacteroidota bacterium]